MAETCLQRPFGIGSGTFAYEAWCCPPLVQRFGLTQVCAFCGDLSRGRGSDVQGPKCVVAQFAKLSRDRGWSPESKVQGNGCPVLVDRKRYRCPGSLLYNRVSNSIYIFSYQRLRYRCIGCRFSRPTSDVSHVLIWKKRAVTVSDKFMKGAPPVRDKRSQVSELWLSRGEWGQFGPNW